MNEFWLWFWRPIAEFFGYVAMFAIFTTGILGVIFILSWVESRKQKKEPK